MMIIGNLRISPHYMQPITGVLTMWHIWYSQTVAECDPIRGVQSWQGTCRSMVSSDRKERRSPNVLSEPTMT